MVPYPNFALGNPFAIAIACTLTAITLRMMFRTYWTLHQPAYNYIDCQCYQGVSILPVGRSAALGVFGGSLNRRSRGSPRATRPAQIFPGIVFIAPSALYSSATTFRLRSQVFP